MKHDIRSTAWAAACWALFVAPVSTIAADTAKPGVVPMVVQKNVMVAMRDSVRLATDVYRPTGDGPFPVVLIRTPYGSEDDKYVTRAQYYVEHGYALAVQDCRGKFDSDGDWYGKRDEAKDGSDTITWLGTQPWSSGKVGMTGPSYMGMVQYWVADQENPYLKALVPLVAPVTLGRDVTDYDYLTTYSSRESTINLGWMLGTDGRGNQVIEPSSVKQSQDHLPRADSPRLFGRKMEWWTFQLNQRYGFWEEYYLRAAQGEWSKPVAIEAYLKGYPERYRKVRVPMLHVSGWWDCCGEQLIKTFQLVRRYATEPLARDHQRLIMGPWIHSLGHRKEGAYDFGPQAEMNPDELSVRWFDRWLKGEENNEDKQPAVRVFVMGENRWRDASDWPIPGTEFTKFHLRSNGEARLSRGGGQLTQEPPRNETVDRYTYDPGNPTPTILGPDVTWRDISIGPVDMTALEQRDDVLVYTTEPLKKPIEVTGPLTAVIYMATSAPSTDLFVRLLDVHPNGKPYNMFYTYAANPYRTHWAKDVETARDGSRIIKAEIALPPTSNLFQVGHRIRVEISSASAPRYRGLNVAAGTEPYATRWNIAHQKIYHDREHPSHIVLPVVPR